MKILVMSDSHSGMSFMRACVRAVRPDVMIHLGDHYEDGQAVSQEFPHIPMHQVPGNCDRYRCIGHVPELLCYDVCGVRMLMTHGHNHHVKSTLSLLLAEARKRNAAAVLYGHTHVADCRREEDGLWILNPGSCGSSGGSVGLMEVEQGKILRCKILRQQDVLNENIR